jgi:hypothetical protein
VKIVKIAGIMLVSTFFAHNAFADNHISPNALSGVAGLTDVAVSDVPGYVAALKRRADIFSDLGATVAGICSAVSGGDVPGEAVVYSFFPSMEAGMTAIQYQLSSQRFMEFANSLSAYRELTGNRMQRVIRPYDGEMYDTFATRGLYVRTDNPEAYIDATAALESAFHRNGFDDVSIDVYQDIGSGSRSDLLYLVAVAPSLPRLGEVLDAVFSEPWAQQVFANAVSARSQIVEDKFYSCQTIYNGM